MCQSSGLLRLGAAGLRRDVQDRGVRLEPRLLRRARGSLDATIELRHPAAGRYFVYAEGAPELLFTENETNTERLFGSPNRAPYVKDAFHRAVVEGEAAAVNPAPAARPTEPSGRA